MSVTDHERAAQEDEKLAASHQDEYEEDAWHAGGSCTEFCFSTWSNPTAEHAELAKRYRARAARHREASKALRDAEQAACHDIPERDRDISPFFHKDDVIGFEPTATSGPERPAIIRVHFKPIEGLDMEHMQHLVDCHLARNAALGHEAAEMPYCPLMLKGVSARVEPASTGLDIVLSVDAAALVEVESRLQALKSGE